jgi:hypothetical protein
MNITSPDQLLENGIFKAGILAALKSYLYATTVVEEMRPAHAAVSSLAMIKFKPVVEDIEINRSSKRAPRIAGERVESYERLYLASDKATDEIYTYYATEMEKRGYTAEGDKCPWLVACNLQMMSESILIGVMQPYTQISNTNLYIKGKRDEYIKIIVGLLVTIASNNNFEINIIKEALAG